MKISVVIPTYNRAALIRRAVDSVLTQTRPADEIIVVDDGSRDETVKVLQSYKERISLILQDNHGVSAARNRGIKAATGEWIAFLDSDDIWYPQKLAKQIAWHQSHSDTEWSHTAEIWIRNGREIRQKGHHAKPEGACFKENLSFCKIAPSSVMVHRSLFEKVGTFDEMLPVCEDYDLWLRFLRHFPIGLLHEPLVVKYAGHQQLSFSGYIMDYYRIEALLKHLPDVAVIKEVTQKNEILKRGAQKHGNRELLRFCEEVEERLTPVRHSPGQAVL